MRDTTSHRYAVFGHPVAHSLSPEIHRAFAAQSGRSLRYDAIDAPPETFAAQLAAFRADGGGGANVTLPLKNLARDLCRERSETADRCGAVNTLVALADGGWRGDNTDGAGLVIDLTGRQRLDLRGRDVLLLGAGGAAQAAAWALLDAGIDTLTVVNRTPEKADALADRIGEPGRVHVRYWEDLADLGSFDLIVNGTSAGVKNQTLDLPFTIVAPRALCYDLSYGTAATYFLAWARSAGAALALDGLGMLVEQAAVSFELWHGVRPDTDPVYATLAARVHGA